MRLSRTVCLVGILLVFAGCDALVGTEKRVERARAALDSGDNGRAGIELQKAVQREPDNAAARVLLARLSLVTGDSQNAQREIDRAIKLGARGPEVDALRVQVWFALNQPQSLLDAIANKTVEITEPARSLVLARAYNALGKPDQAIDALGSVLNSGSVPTAARLVRAEALALRGDLDLALRELDATIATDQQSFEAPLYKGTLLARRGQFALAEPALRTALDRMPPTAPVAQRAAALAAITDVCLAQGRLQQAIETEGKLAQLLPDASVTRLLGARIKLVQGDYSGGIADLQRIVAASPDFLQARMLLGAAHLTQGNLLQAESQLSAVVRLAGDNIEARKLLARVRLQLDQPDAALHALTPAAESDVADPQLYALLGGARLRAGDAGAAVETLERGVRANPTNTDLKLDLAQLYLKAGRAHDALELLNGATEPEDATRYDMLFVASLNADRGLRAARDEIERLVASRPKSIPTLNLAAAFFAARWEFERARSLLGQALSIDAHNVPTLANLARIAVVTGDRTAAESALRDALAANEGNVAVRIALSDLLMRRGAYADAQQLLEAGQARAPGPDLQLALGQAHLARGDVAGAGTIFDRVIAANPDRAPLVNQIGQLLLDGHQYAAALARFRRAAELSPKSAMSWINAGRAQLALDDPAAARESFEKALALQPDSVPAVASLALIDVRAKKFDAALARAESLRAARPDDADVLVLKGDVQLASGAHRDAEDSYATAQRRRPDAATAVKLFQARRMGGRPKPEESLRQWLALQPADFRVRSALAEYLLSQNDFKGSVSELELVVQQMPANPVMLNNLAWAYFRLGDVRAQSVAERAYQSAPNSGAIADTLGWILASKRTTERALVLLEQAARAGPSEPEVQYHYAYVLAQAGRREEARKVLARTLDTTRNFPERRQAEQLLAELKV